MGVPTVDQVLEEVRERGGRVTTARRLIIDAILHADAHVNAEDLAAVVQATHPEVNLSTVYRTLDSLEALGIVQHTHVGHGPAVYHLGKVHQHLVCEACGDVIDIPAKLLDELSTTLRRRYGFQLHIGHFALLGRCNTHRPPPRGAADHGRP